MTKEEFDKWGEDQLDKRLFGSKRQQAREMLDAAYNLISKEIDTVLKDMNTVIEKETETRREFENFKRQVNGKIANQDFEIDRLSKEISEKDLKIEKLEKELRYLKDPF